MIQIVLGCSDDNLLQSCEAQGHANFAPEGFDIVCASVTCLLRTVLAQLESRKTIVVNTIISGRGSLAFSVLSYKEDDKSFLKYAADFIITGINQLVIEYPKCVLLRVN